jgi:hypothetical protein
VAQIAGEEDHCHPALTQLPLDGVATRQSAREPWLKV